jgi:uncharacterized membrane protein HdeD (DUF308 family)
MFDELISRWWIIGARGLVAIVFGVLALLAPAATFAFLVSLFGVFALADGFFVMGAGLALSWFALFLEGFVGGAVGVITLLVPVAGEFWLIQLIVAWGLVTGILELVGAYGLRKLAKGPMAKGEWMLGALGVLSLLFAGAVSVQSQADVPRLMSTLGGYAVLSGLLLATLSLNIRLWPRTA